MNKTNLIKIILILVVVALGIAVLTTDIQAADGWDLIENNTSENNSASEEEENEVNNSLNNTNTNTNNTLRNNTNTNNTSRNNTNTNNASRNNTNTNISNYNNTSKYNNSTNLPDTGLEDSFPTIALIVVFGISAVFAYKKIKDYNNL